MSNAQNNEVTVNTSEGFEVVLANGETTKIVGQLSFNEGIDAQEQEVINNCTANLITELNNVSKGYFNMVGSVAIMMDNDRYKQISNCKSINQYLTEIVRCSKATASELKKVAENFYNSLGQMKNSDFNVFTYTELVKLADKPEEVVKKVADAISLLPNHTREDVVSAYNKVVHTIMLDDVKKSSEEIANEIMSEKTAKADVKSKKSDNKKVEEPKTDYKPLYADVHSKLVAIDVKGMTKEEIAKTIDDIIFDMETNLA